MEKKRNFPLLEQFRHLKKYLLLAGIKLKPRDVIKILVITSLVIDIGIIAYALLKAAEYENIAFMIIITVFMLTLGYLAIFFAVWMIFLVMIDYLKFKRKTELEEVLPEFLRLVSANHRAGFSLDMSIWKANRPRFGILSEEINELARSTYASGNLVESLIKFSEKYDSAILKRVVSNITEGLRTGADISSLLDDISSNITTIRNTRKDLAGEVENYMMFITLTVLIISPLMFGLTYKLSGMIQSVRGILQQTTSGEVSPFPQMKISLEAQTGDFKYYFNLFVYLMIATNCIVSVLLMSMIKHGNLKQDLKRIPVYYIISIVVYIVSRAIFENILQI
jgi:flagellar protein FlaJ